MTRTRKILVTLAVVAAASAGASTTAFADSHSPVAAPLGDGHTPVTPQGDGHFPAPPGDGQMPTPPRS
ncbi:hypothetical protein C9F11_18215 [Streptomyces sp. YIM 121038]|uniref:hypothetical protein n=1 Tax=Streptomyces sp. YIM 121038 TaxID=2136401 RepID=UPI00110FFC47|nr:hypothetical protein [Streptomyces sp. YIM 121038]QCX77295.1 hypothetical protein C9F11_18215 [Streptomyces sp. YIM 121038]